MRYVRVRGPSGVESGRVEDGRVVTDGGARIEPLDPDTLQLPAPYELMAPFDAPEIWCAGVTYERSRDARVEESTVKDVYTMVYDAPRPELFMKDAMMRRTVGPGAPIGIREDSTWNVPEPEIGVVLGKSGRIAGYTIGNDVSSRSIEGENPLYLPQAKIYAGACSFGPSVFVSGDHDRPFQLTLRITDEWGQIVFEGETSTSRMKRSFERARAVAARWTTPSRTGASSSPARASSHPTASRFHPATSSRSTFPRSARSSIPSCVPLS